MPHRSTPFQLVLITGMSGSGKSVALNALEDMGFYCVDNLPPGLLTPLIELQKNSFIRRLAIAIDVRSADALPEVPSQLIQLKAQGIKVDSLFLDASTDTLVRRFSETRRRHPLSKTVKASKAPPRLQALTEAIELEREMLSELRANAHVIDTSILRPTTLQSYIKDFFGALGPQLTLIFQSFAYKRGVPNDADFVFDVRMLPNPHYDPALRELTGRDAPVIDFLQREADVQKMLHQIEVFLENWLDVMSLNHRSYVTVAIGCTGGQHRSVYLVEQLSAYFRNQWVTLQRHREMDK